MVTDNDDILLDADGDDLIIDGDFAIGDGRLDDCLIIVSSNKGTIKSDPMMGPNLQLMINANKMPTELKQAIGLSLQSDGKEDLLEVVLNEMGFRV